MTFLRIMPMAVAIIALAGAPAHAALVQVSYASVTGTTVTFNELLGGGGVPGNTVNTVINSGGMMFGESFVGQTVTPTLNGGIIFDILTGTPSGPLTVQAAANAGENLSVYLDGTDVLLGCGASGNPSPCSLASSPYPNAFASGSIAGLFPSPVAAFGLGIRYANGGSVILQVFASDGTLLGTETVTPPFSTEHFYGFGSTNGAEIAGFSVHSTDDATGIDNIVYGDSSDLIPEPSTGLLVLSGLAAGLRWRRRTYRY